MKPKLFHPGQAITPIDSEKWDHVPPCKDGEKEPAFGKIYHILNYDGCIDGQWFISLVEFGADDCYAEDAFAPIISDDRLFDDLEELIQEKQTI